MSATQLTVNTIRYGSDIFEFQDQGVVEATVPWYIHDVDIVTGFNVDAILPEGTEVRFLFKVASKEALNPSEYSLYKIDEEGGLVVYSGNTNINSVLTEGNTIDEIRAFTDIPGFIDKKVLPIVGLSSNSTGSELPRISLGLSAKTTVIHLQREEEIGIAYFGKTVTIIRCSPEYANEGNGTTEVKASMRNDGIWSAWQGVVSVKERSCDAIRFKFIYRVTTLNGEDGACVNRIRLYYE